MPMLQVGAQSRFLARRMKKIRGASVVLKSSAKIPLQVAWHTLLIKHIFIFCILLGCAWILDSALLSIYHVFVWPTMWQMVYAISRVCPSIHPFVCMFICFQSILWIVWHLTLTFFLCIYTVVHKKTCHFTLDYNLCISWWISTLCAPMEKGISILPYDLLT